MNEVKETEFKEEIARKRRLAIEASDRKVLDSFVSGNMKASKAPYWLILGTLLITGGLLLASINLLVLSKYTTFSGNPEEARTFTLVAEFGNQTIEYPNIEIKPQLSLNISPYADCIEVKSPNATSWTMRCKSG